MNMNEKLEAIASFANAHGWQAQVVTGDEGFDVVRVRCAHNHFAVKTSEGFCFVSTMTGLIGMMGRNEDGTEI